MQFSASVGNIIDGHTIRGGNLDEGHISDQGVIDFGTITLIEGAQRQINLRNEGTASSVTTNRGVLSGLGSLGALALGPGSVSLSGSDADAFTLTGLAVPTTLNGGATGGLTFTIRVDDFAAHDGAVDDLFLSINDGSGSVLVPLEGAIGNLAPTAALAAATDFDATHLSRVFDASGSNDPDTAAPSYQWSRVVDANGDGSFDETSTALPGAADQTMPSLSIADLGLRHALDRAEVTVTVDDGEFSDSAAVTIGYSNAAPALIAESMIISATTDNGGRVELSAGISDIDLAANTLVTDFEQVEWQILAENVLGGPLLTVMSGVDSGTGTDFSMGGVLTGRDIFTAFGGPGTFDLTFQVRDRAGAMEELDFMTVASGTVEIRAVPTPAALGLLGLGAAAALRRRA